MLDVVAMPDGPHAKRSLTEVGRVARDLDVCMVGESRPMFHLTQLIRKVAQSDSTVLIHGESGTGKELVARAIHRHSQRSQKAFVAINCAAIPDALVESELFGYEKGAFTGAVGSKRGRLELAKDGTVLL